MQETTRPLWLDAVNNELARLGVRRCFDFDRDFVLVELDYNQATDPKQVAHAIAKGTHPLFGAPQTTETETIPQ